MSLERLSHSACTGGSVMNEERKGLLRAAPPTDRRMSRGSFLCVLTVLGVFLLLVLTTNVGALFDVLHVDGTTHRELLPTDYVLVTGGAGFVGFHLSSRLKRDGIRVLAIDNMNPYYSTALKAARAALLRKRGIELIEGDVCDSELLARLFTQHRFTHVAHMAAQAGVRYSLTNPQSYIRQNLQCFVALLETHRLFPRTKLIYASSSSVYGSNAKAPFSELDRVDSPNSLYAASKKANEAIAHVYHGLYRIPARPIPRLAHAHTPARRAPRRASRHTTAAPPTPTHPPRCRRPTRRICRLAYLPQVTGLRFFTVYGPWGRPDMAYFSFTHRISKGLPIKARARASRLRLRLRWQTCRPPRPGPYPARFHWLPRPAGLWPWHAAARLYVRRRHRRRHRRGARARRRRGGLQSGAPPPLCPTPWLRAWCGVRAGLDAWDGPGSGPHRTRPRRRRRHANRATTAPRA